MSTALRCFFFKYQLEILLLTGLVFLVYGNTLDNAFISDDIAAIANNPNIGSPKSIQDPIYSAKPLLNMIIFHVFGINPLFFRLVNIIFHVINTILFFELTMHLSGQKHIAFGTSAIFAVHPVASESVSWISGGVYPQYTLLLLLSFLVYRSENLTRLKRHLGTVGFFLLALLSNEKAIVFPLILILYELSKGAFIDKWKKTIPCFSLSLIWGGLLLTRLSERIEVVSSPSGSTQTFKPFEQIPIALFGYLKLFVWPKILSFYHTELLFTPYQYHLILTFVTLFLLLTLAIYRVNKTIFFGLGLFIISLLPTLTPLGVSWIIAERYVYFGLGGLAIAVVTLLARICKRFPEMVFYTALAIIIILLGTRTIRRNKDWQDADTLWVATAKTAPHSPNAHNNLADVYSRRKEFEKARKELLRAIELQEDYVEAYHNLGNVYMDLGKTQEAIQAYENAIEIDQTLWQSHQNIASAYFHLKEYQKAKKHLQQAIEINPSYHALYTNLGIVFYTEGKQDQAIAAFNRALEINPQDRKALNGLQQAKTGSQEN